MRKLRKNNRIDRITVRNSDAMPSEESGVVHASTSEEIQKNHKKIKNCIALSGLRVAVSPYGLFALHLVATSSRYPTSCSFASAAPHARKAGSDAMRIPSESIDFSPQPPVGQARP